MEIEITKKGMYPEFTLDGIEYSAERNYARGGGLPVAIVRCTRKNLAETKEEYKHGRKKMVTVSSYLLARNSRCVIYYRYKWKK